MNRLKIEEKFTVFIMSIQIIRNPKRSIKSILWGDKKFLFEVGGFEISRKWYIICTSIAIFLVVCVYLLNMHIEKRRRDLINRTIVDERQMTPSIFPERKKSYLEPNLMANFNGFSPIGSTIDTTGGRIERDIDPLAHTKNTEPAVQNTNEPPLSTISVSTEEDDTWYDANETVENTNSMIDKKNNEVFSAADPAGVIDNPEPSAESVEEASAESGKSRIKSFGMAVSSVVMAPVKEMYQLSSIVCREWMRTYSNIFIGIMEWAKTEEKD